MTAFIARAVTRPRLLFFAIAIAWRFRKRGWYRSWPFLPIPSRRYIEWRLYTAYGDEHATPDLDEAERYLRWVYRFFR